MGCWWFEISVLLFQPKYAWFSLPFVWGNGFKHVKENQPEKRCGSTVCSHEEKCFYRHDIDEHISHVYYHCLSRSYLCNPMYKYTIFVVCMCCWVVVYSNLSCPKIAESNVVGPCVLQGSRNAVKYEIWRYMCISNFFPGAILSWNLFILTLTLGIPWFSAGF